MSKYKYKIGDKVKLVFCTQNIPMPICRYFLDKQSIITNRSKSRLGNEYEIYNPKNNKFLAWVYEIQLKKW